MIQVCVFTQRRIKSWGVCGTHLASVTPDLGWTSYLDPWGSSFPSAGRVMLSLQSACQDQHSQLKTFPHLTVSVCFAFPTKWFSTIYSIALVLIGGASWGRTLPTFANVSTNLASAKLRGRGIRSFTSSRKWKEILKSVVWSGVSVFPSVTQSLLRKKLWPWCACTGFLTDLTDTLGCFHAVHLRSIKKPPSVTNLQLLHVCSNN